MTDALGAAIKASSSGLFAQSRRMAVVAENIANAASTSTVPGGDAYRRKTISFGAGIDAIGGDATVRVADIGLDSSPFPLELQPSHPAANEKGYVKLPNVDVTVELADMRESTRSYQANIQVIKQAREMISMTINMLGGSS